jgi:hypothetical protein
MRVFICSTCYDLIDLRAEMSAFLRDAGATPLISDALDSNFEVLPDRNAIETCLSNVRSCDEFLIVLSNRYGPSLAPRGYDDLSASHLEYREAKATRKPIHMYVRDRLEADYKIWCDNRQNPDLKLAWCKEPKDWKIFELLQEHRQLEREGVTSNWLWPFADSVQLKQRMKADFKAALARAVADKLFENGRIPFLDVSGAVKGHDQYGIRFELIIRNLGTAVAITPLLTFENDDLKREIPSLAPEQSASISMNWGRNYASTLELKPRLSYSIIEGHEFIDEADLHVRCKPEPDQPSVNYHLRQRRYVGSSTGFLIT